MGVKGSRVQISPAPHHDGEWSRLIRAAFIRPWAVLDKPQRRGVWARDSAHQRQYATPSLDEQESYCNELITIVPWCLWDRWGQ